MRSPHGGRTHRCRPTERVSVLGSSEHPASHSFDSPLRPHLSAAERSLLARLPTWSLGSHCYRWWAFS